MEVALFFKYILIYMIKITLLCEFISYFCIKIILKYSIMIKQFLPLIDWTMGIIGGVILFLVFGGLALWLILMMRKPKGE